MTQRRVVGLEVVSEERHGDGGFLTVRRLRLRNRRDDGTRSDEYVCDFVVRPRGDDAVAVVLYRVVSSEVSVLLRHELRPALSLGREGDPQALFIQAVVAGIIEKGDIGSDGVANRALAEVYEEAGYRIERAALRELGPPAFPSPGAMVEKLYLFSAEIRDEDEAHLAPGDGSPMEEGASTQWCSLEKAIASCDRGDVVDMKTELLLRRLDARSRAGRL